MKNILLRFKTVPRWAILLLDVSIVTFSFALSYFITQQFNFPVMIRGYFLLYTGFFGLISTFVFLLLRVHTGLIRYSDSNDLLRIFFAMFITTMIFIAGIHFILAPLWGLSPVNITVVVVINFFTSTTALMLLRILVKNIYHVLIHTVSKQEKIHVVIYGSDQNAVMAKQALEGGGDSQYVVVGFVDTNRRKLNSYIERKRVYHLKDLTELKEKQGIQQLMLAREDLTLKDKNLVVEKCLRLDIKVLTVPPAAEWVSGQLTRQQIKNLKIEDLLQRAPIQLDNIAVRNDLFDKRVLITGAAGSIGSEIVRQVILFKPRQIILCDQAESPLYELQLEIEEKFGDVDSVFAVADVRNVDRMRAIFERYRPEIVYHAAAYKHVPIMEDNPAEAISTNVGGTKNIADLAVAFGVGKFVMVSTDKAVNPTNVMGASKRIAEIYTQCLNIEQRTTREMASNLSAGHYTKFITTRFGNVLGSNGSVIPRFRAQIEKGGPVTVTHPEITRYFMIIPEAVQLVLEAGTMGQGGEIYVFDMGSPVKMADLATKMIQLAGMTPGKDIDIVYTGLRSGEKLYEELLNDEEKVLPTHHEKISIAQVTDCDAPATKQLIVNLLAISKSSDKVDVVRRMKEIVPEFISKNSPYTQLDAKSEVSTDIGNS